MGKFFPHLMLRTLSHSANGGFHSKPNGILLRKDIHSVFATVDEGYRFLVSKKVKEVFNNGEEYLRLDGKVLRLPKQKSDWPNIDFLRWHNINRFLS
jgi:putative restriction endonuclease